MLADTKPEGEKEQLVRLVLLELAWGQRGFIRRKRGNQKPRQHRDTRPTMILNGSRWIKFVVSGAQIHGFSV